jgi:hypothetical protein
MDKGIHKQFKQHLNEELIKLMIGHQQGKKPMRVDLQHGFIKLGTTYWWLASSTLGSSFDFQPMNHPWFTFTLIHRLVGRNQQVKKYWNGARVFDGIPPTALWLFV